jgi:hypothetical protein
VLTRATVVVKKVFVDSWIFVVSTAVLLLACRFLLSVRVANTISPAQKKSQVVLTHQTHKNTKAMMKYLPAYVLLLESISLCQGANSEQLGLSSDRRLYEKVSVYQPGSLVTDHVSALA